MGFSLGDALTNQGMNQESARFVEACVTAGSAQDFKLVQMGFSPPLAIELARQINAYTFRADYLVNLGMPFPQARALVEGGGVLAETAALIARFTTAPAGARTVLINNLVVAGKAHGWWDKGDALYVRAAHNGLAGDLGFNARRNWIQNLVNETEVNAPTFTEDRGYAGNGSTSYLATGLTPSTFGGKATLNSQTLAVWVNNDPGAANSSEAGANDATGPTTLSAWRIADGLALGRSSGPNLFSALTTGTALGLTSITRTASNALSLRRNKTSLNTSTGASTNLATGALTTLALSGSFNFSLRRAAVTFYGAGLTVAENDYLYDDLNTYLTAVGGA